MNIRSNLLVATAMAVILTSPAVAKDLDRAATRALVQDITRSTYPGVTITEYRDRLYPSTENSMFYAGGRTLRPLHGEASGIVDDINWFPMSPTTRQRIADSARFDRQSAVRCFYDMCKLLSVPNSNEFFVGARRYAMMTGGSYYDTETRTFWDYKTTPPSRQAPYGHLRGSGLIKSAQIVNARYHRDQTN